MFQWKRFNFFEKRIVTDAIAKPLVSLIESTQIVCTSAGRSQLLFGDGNGQVYSVTHNFEVAKFQAYKSRVTHLEQLKDANIVVAIGDDDNDLNVMKIFDLDEPVEDNASPHLTKTINLTTAKSLPVPVTSVAVCESPGNDQEAPSIAISVGLANGVVLLIQGPDVRSLARIPIRPVDDHPITGLGFVRRPAGPLSLFVVTSERVSCITLGSALREEVLDEVGCDPGCAVVTDKGELVIARDEAIYMYMAEGRGPCFAFESVKQMLKWYNSHLIVVSSTPTGVGGVSSADSVTIYDLRNKYIAFHGAMASNARVSLAFCEWNSAFFLTGGGEGKKIIQLTEKETQTKLDILFKRNLYTIALNLARDKGFDRNIVIDIYRKYGDHLYNKGDYDTAIEQYCRTIGRLEPSYVIRKFLDAQRIHNLTYYLEELHRTGIADSNHTTLLLNCYTKLKDVTKLDHFVQAGLNFKVDNAIRVCKESGYLVHALFLAFVHQQSDAYLRIQIEERQDYADALHFIKTLKREEAEKFIKMYGKELMAHLPEDTTRLVMNLCTRFEPVPVTTPSALSRFNVEDAVKAKELLDRTKQKKREEEDDHSSNGRASSALDRRTSYLAASEVKPAGSEEGGEGKDEDEQARHEKERKRAEEFVPIFVGNSHWLTVFLEFLLHQHGPPAESPTLWNTLLEMYLIDEEVIAEQQGGAASAMSAGANERDRAGTTTESSSTTGGGRAGARVTIATSTPSVVSGGDGEGGRELSLAQKKRLRQEKALELLQNPKSKYDVAQALVLVQVHDFPAGKLFLCERNRLYREILQYYMEARDHENILAACRKYGQKNPNLWVDALNYFAQVEGSGCEREVEEALTAIERGKLLPPLVVVQILSKNPHLKLKTVKGFLLRHLEADKKEMQDDERLIDQYRKETEKMKEEYRVLNTSAKIFQASKCAICSSPLDLPSIHFLCGHSCHHRCLGDEETECSICYEENNQVRQMVSSLAASASQHDRFFKQLKGAEDGFSVVAEFFGRGVFSKAAAEASKSADEE
mmetsp:Transcript_31850/g.83140  ORF Transcript_31850/g.83140 Transcript_31850/m.83140 type:complete len:1035 (-) Transcript_31850:100-3204(-)